MFHATAPLKFQVEFIRLGMNGQNRRITDGTWRVIIRHVGLNARLARVVECRYFAGMNIEETACALALSPATVKRDWGVARAWLNKELVAL